MKDFQNQFTYQSSALSVDADPTRNEAIDSIIQYNGILTTGFQLGMSAENDPAGVGAPGNSPLALTLAIEKGMQLNTNGQHVDYIQVHADDFVDNTDPTHPQPILDLEPVTQWIASLFDTGKLSVFDQTAFDTKTNQR